MAWGRQGHCVVAYVPKPDGKGRALLVYGTDWLSIVAGGFLTDEASLAALHRRLGIGTEGRIPYFELLLEAELTGGAVTSYRPVAHRAVRDPS